jgi:phospholipid-transporting ATPase
MFGNSSTLPSSLPKNWPRSSEADIAERPSRRIKLSSPQEFYFRNNFVKTSKYELWDFLPKFLLEEFNPRTKVANCYFLMISALQCIPMISNTQGYPTTLIPLLFVVLIDAIFQIIEDLARHRADTEANASIATRYDPVSGSFQPCKWYQLEVGNYVKVSSRETIPADILILGVAEKSAIAQGLCYVETKSLDGETNLKVRNALPKTLAHVSLHLAYA